MMAMKMSAKWLLFAMLIVTASSLPQEVDYDEPDYTGDEIEDGEDDSFDYDAEPPEFSVDSQRLIAKEGETVLIPCTTVETLPYVLIIKKVLEEKEDEILFVDDTKIFRDRRYKLNNQQLEISKLRRSDAGSYTCSIMSTPPLKVTHFLDVQYSPKFTDKSSMEQRVRQGDDVMLSCEATGNPVPTVRWSREEGRLPSGVRNEEGISMSLADVDRHVEGTYVCTADNGVGDPVSKSISLYVEYGPEILTEKDMVRTEDGDIIELVCIVHARPSPMIKWTKDGSPITTDSHLEEQQNGGHRNTIRISQISKEDFGEYTCHAENEFDRKESTIALTGLPNPPHFTSSPNGGEETTYTLTWETDSYYPVTEYRLKYRKAKANDSTDEPGEWVDMTYEVNNNLETDGLTHTMKHTLSDLQAATDYEASVQIKNEFMWGDAAEFPFSTRKETAQQTKISGATSVGFNTVLLLITAVLFRT